MNNIITIGLVTWNGDKYIRYCLDSVLEQTFQDYKLIILDNGSTDNIVNIIENQYAEKFGDKMFLIKNSKNIGFAKGHNKIIKMSDSKYNMFLNQDVILDKEYLNRALEVFQQQTNVGVVSGKIYKWDFNNKNKTKYIDSLGLELHKNGRVVEKLVGKLDEGQFNQDVEVFGVSGTIPILLKIALEDVKYNNEYLDESFFSYKEDIDLAYRLRWEGYNAYISSKAIAYHDRTAKSSLNTSVKMTIEDRKIKSELVNYHSYKNHIITIYKNMSFGLLLRYGFYVKIYELKKLIYLLINEKKTLKSWNEIWKLRKEIWKKRKYIMSKRKVSNSQMSKWFI